MICGCSSGSSSTWRRSTASATSGGRRLGATSRSPRLSAALRSLESELRLPARPPLAAFEGFTPEGERILLWAHRTLNDLDGMTQEASRLRGGLEGSLRIGAIPTSLPASTHLTRRFRARHPNVTIRLQSMTSRQIAHGLAHGELDAGLTYLDNEPLPGVDALPLWREQLLLVVDATGPFRDATRSPGATRHPFPSAC